MKYQFYLLLNLIFLLACKNSSEPIIDYCRNSISELGSQSFKGTIFICNAQPPEMAFWPGEAEVSLIDENTISIHLRSDTTSLDTTFQFSVECYVVEETGTCVKLFDENQFESGGYNTSVNAIQFTFGYKECLNNTFFEGFGNE